MPRFETAISGDPKEESLRRPGGRLVRAEENKVRELPLDDIVAASGLSREQISPLVFDVFTEPNFVAALPERLRADTATLGMWLRHSCLFDDLLRPAHSREILGPLITHPSSLRADGRERREESGNEVLVEKIKEAGVDLRYVLFFRRTTPAEGKSKPELYWTSDYWETLRGLDREIAGEHRSRTMIFCSTLEDLSSDSRLATDINDDNGLAVRRESVAPYDQDRTLFSIKTPD